MYSTLAQSLNDQINKPTNHIYTDPPCRVQFSIATPLQKAVADMLDEAKQPYEGFPSYYAWLVAQYERKRYVCLGVEVDVEV